MSNGESFATLEEVGLEIERWLGYQQVTVFGEIPLVVFLFSVTVVVCGIGGVFNKYITDRNILLIVLPAIVSFAALMFAAGLQVYGYIHINSLKKDYVASMEWSYEGRYEEFVSTDKGMKVKFKFRDIPYERYVYKVIEGCEENVVRYKYVLWSDFGQDKSLYLSSKSEDIEVCLRE